MKIGHTWDVRTWGADGGRSSGNRAAVDVAPTATLPSILARAAKCLQPVFLTLCMHVPGQKARIQNAGLER